MNTYKLPLLLFYAITILVGYSGIVMGQEAPSVGITPALAEAIVKRGSSYIKNFTITNSTTTRLRFNCSVEDVWYDEQNKRVMGRPGTLPRSASLWVQLSPSEVIIEPNSSAVVKAVITVPQSATGSYYAVPVFEGMPVEKPATNDLAQQNITAKASIGIRFNGLIMLTTTEGSEYSLEIMNGKVIPPTASTELELSLDIRNRGTAHAKVRGAFAILNASGALVGRGNLNEKRYLPTLRDTVKGYWSGELTPGNYTSIVTISYDRVGLEPSSMVYEIPFSVK